MPPALTSRDSVPPSAPASPARAAAQPGDGFLGIGLFQFELILTGVAAAVSMLFWVFGNPPSVGPTLIVGSCGCA